MEEFQESELSRAIGETCQVDGQAKFEILDLVYALREENEG